MKRREFNLLAATLTAEAVFGLMLEGCTTSSTVGQAPDKLLRKGRIVAATASETSSCSLRLMDWDTLQTTDIEIPLNSVHSITQDKVDREILYLFEGFGSAAKVNLKTGSILKVDHRTANVMFKGHGALSTTNDFLVCTETSPVGGVTRLRSTKNFSVVGELPESCGISHQVVTLPGTSIVASGYAKDSKIFISFYDLSSKRMVNTVETEALAVHLLPYSSTEVYGACLDYEKPEWSTRLRKIDRESNSSKNMTEFTAGLAGRPAPLAYASTHGGSRSIFDESSRDILRMTFGLAKSPDGRIFSTHPPSGKVLVWKDLDVVQVIDAPKPRSVQISSDGSEFIVLADGKLRRHSAHDYQLIEELQNWPSITTISSYA